MGVSSAPSHNRHDYVCRGFSGSLYHGSLNTSFAMHHRRTISLWVAALSLVACRDNGAGSSRQHTANVTSGGQSASYTIRLHRPARVGQRLRVRVDATNTEGRSTRSGSSEIERQQSRRRTSLDCVQEVLAVNRVGKPTRIALTIAQLQSDSDDGSLASVPAGARLEVSLSAREAESTITIGGEPVAPPVRLAIKDVLSLTSDEVTDDEAFGTSLPRAVGATWPARVGALRSSLEETGMSVPEGAVRATVTLAGISQREPGAPLLLLTGDVSIEGMTLTQLPAGFSSSSMTTRMRMEKTVSASALDAPPVSEASVMESHAELRGEIDGRPVTITMSMRSEKRAAFSPAE